MKIVHISVASTGGAGTAAYRLHLSLLKSSDINSDFIQQYNNQKNHNEHIYTVPHPSSLLYRIQKKTKLRPELKIRKQITRFYPNYEIVTLPTTPYRLENHPIIKKADIIHLHWIADFVNYPTFFKSIKQPIVWTLHDMNPFMGIFHYEGDRTINESNLGKIDKQIEAKKTKDIHRKKDIHIVCPSNWLKEKSENSKAFSIYSHSVIPHGLDLSNYPALDKKEASTKIGINNILYTLLFVSHSTSIYRKGFDILLESLKNIKIPFNLISVGGEKINIENQCINHIHYERVYEMSLLNTIYSSADITIIPSREDVFNLVMIESIANGTPVISFNNGGMAEHIRTGINGILLPDISIQSLTDSINDFIEGKYNFDKDLIREYAKNNFSDTLQAQRYIELYKDILNNK